MSVVAPCGPFWVVAGLSGESLVATAPLTALRRVEPDPAGALARGDYARLADIELTRLGLRATRSG